MQKAKEHQLGTHFICEFSGCDSAVLNDEALLKEIMLQAVVESKATLINFSSHAFSPHGVTAYALLAESHISIHTWPEFGYAAVDIFTCGETMKPEHAVPVFTEGLKTQEKNVKRLRRGFS